MIPYECSSHNSPILLTAPPFFTHNSSIIYPQHNSSTFISLGFFPTSAFDPLHSYHQITYTMDSSSRVEGGLVGLTPEQLIQEFISLRIDRWRSKKKDVPDQELAAHLFAMSWNYDSLPPEGPGCIMAGGSTGHIYIPYDDSRSGLPPEIEARIDMVDQWLGDPANAPVLRGMDQIMRRQIDDYCFSEFLEGGNASRVDFLGKVTPPSLRSVLLNPKPTGN